MSTSEFGLLIFDWDGTIVDSEARIVIAVQRAIRDVGLPERSHEQIRAIIGLGLREAMRVLFPDAPAPGTIEELVAGYRHHFIGEGDKPIALFPQVAPVLQELRARGHVLAVATGKGRRGLDRDLAATGLSPLFEATRCADEAPSKPHPAMVLELLADLAFTPEQTLVIGDTDYDIDMAHAAGARSVGVESGVHGRERLLESEPLDILDTVADLPAWLDQR